LGVKRFLHWVFRVADRKKTLEFYTEVLGMKVLRHEEFTEGCEAKCNGPYDGHWSKTMVGYGPEDNHFVVELTYNYGVKSYKLGNDFGCIAVHDCGILERAQKKNWPIQESAEGKFVSAPDGYKFKILEKTNPNSDPVEYVSINVTDLHKSVDFWSNLLAMKVLEQSAQSALLSYGGPHKLQLVHSAQPIDHAEAYGRVAFSCTETPKGAEDIIGTHKKGHILKPYVSLDTPGKATVQVVILGDPDGYEICFVNDQGFRALSKLDPAAPKLLEDAILEDKSDQWKGFGVKKNS